MGRVYFVTPGMSPEITDWFTKSRRVDIDYRKIDTDNKRSALRNWLEDHCSSGVLIQTERVSHAGRPENDYPVYIRITFEDEEDAVLFKLTWE